MAESYQTNLLNVASCYVKRLNVPITITALKQSLEENPYYPSLFSLSNTFERFQIPHEAFKIEKENFEQLSVPFIAYLKNQPTGKDFVLVTAVANNEVNYIAESKKIKTFAKEDFLNNWENIVLQAGDIDGESGEKDYQLNHKKEIAKAKKRIVLVCTAALLLCSVVYFFVNSLPVHFITSAVTILTIKIFGLAVTALLLVYEIDKSNAFVKSICTTVKHTDCNAVLQSKASKIMGMSWSESGFFYFAATLLFLWFPGINFTTKIFTLSLANCLAAPYILFSVYYQWKVAKQWCPLCLMVQAVLLMELVWSIVSFWLHPIWPVASLPIVVLSIAFCLLLPIVSWYVIKPLFLKSKNERAYKAAYKRLLYNPDTFNNLLQQQASAPDGYQNIGITIGNPDATNTIIKVCNPYCGPCAKAHSVIEEILHYNKDVKLKLIFTASNQANDERGLVARHLLAISKKQDALQTRQALDDWYLADKKDYDAFARKYAMNGEIKEQEPEIEKMSEWCKEAEITGTPTFFINGKRLPGTYNINELKYIL
jgi:uncharacterized membrane protein